MNVSYYVMLPRFAGALPTAGYGHAATALKNGQVLITGPDGAEFFDPASGTIRWAGNMAVERYFHTATLMPDGRVLIVSGYTQDASAEIFDPASGLFTRAANMIFPRIGHTATLLPDGSVFIAGGAGVSGFSLHFVRTTESYKDGSTVSCCAEGRISAYPNPCAVVRGDTCTSYLSWKTSGASNVQVWVKINDGPETPFANDTSCDGLHCPAPWIVGHGLVSAYE